jgi:hypothetical protein
MDYPSFDDENNLSFVIFLKCCGVGVLFPGEVEGAGWRSLMATPAFITVLGHTSVGGLTSWPTKRLV